MCAYDGSAAWLAGAVLRGRHMRADVAGSDAVVLLMVPAMMACAARQGVMTGIAMWVGGAVAICIVHVWDGLVLHPQTWTAAA